MAGIPTTQVIRKTILTPFQRFLHTESAGGILLIFFTLFAMLWANSPWAQSYFALWENKLTIGFGDWALSKELILWVNDGLMAIFFFLVGLEIKREVLIGELSSVKKASLPFFAAIGGMVLPALLFILLQQGRPGASGWGIPMATDIAFSLGILSLLGKRVPVSMKIFLTAFAIVDDIGAVLVIALFYSNEIYLTALYIALGLFAILPILNFFNVKKKTPYLLLGIVIWYFFLKSGLHPTIAGIMVAFTIPISSRIRCREFVEEIEENLTDFRDYNIPNDRLLTYEQLSAVGTIERAAESVQPPLQKLEHSLHTFVAFFILPVFALANAGVALGDAGAAFSNPLTLNIAMGLLIGKTVGITLLSWIGVKAGFASLPEGTYWKHIIGLGLLGGVGFTMALFIANLAFTDAELLGAAKIGILLGSTIAGVGGYILLRITLPKVSPGSNE
ncbi:Na+/H+ antiporter NhaA [Nafulsella turpanensis]|uniref:Na+/H+ antiporter NhaA n=1 Tax=Nafulsella turpanensis TaxID=1265690 RepID=UPI00034AF690|nr:Na+/H+ antiporter NhaA [Nafulsella turpanensis]